MGLLFNRGFLVLGLALISSTSFAVNEPYAVEVRSTFSDEGQKKEVRGQGFLVRVPGFFGSRFFVVTASHVSQGENLSLLMGERSLKVLGRLADNASDIEVLEVESVKDLSPLAIMNEGRLELDSALIQKLETETPVDQHMLLSPRHMVLLGGSWLGKKKNWGGRNALEILKKNNGGNHSFSDGVVIGAQGDTFPPGVWENQVQWVLGNEWITARLSLMPGMSGSALVDREKKVVEGVASHFSRDFNRAYFVPAKKIGWLLSQYVDGRREIVNCTHWKMRAGLTYRDYCGGTLEINPLFRLSGDGTKADGGDATKADGGGSVSDVVDVRPGILWKGSPVYAFRLSPKKGTLQRNFLNVDRVIYADRFALERLPKLSETYEIAPIEKGEPLSNTSSFAFLQRIEMDLVCGLVKNQAKNSERAKITVINGRVQAVVPTCFGDILTFSFSAKFGEFPSLIRLKGNKTGHDYTVDLRPIFFEDLSQSLADENQNHGHGVGIVTWPGMDSLYQPSFQIVNVTMEREHYVPLNLVSKEAVVDIAWQISQILSGSGASQGRPCFRE